MKTKMAIETKMTPQMVKTAKMLNPTFRVAPKTTITAMIRARPIAERVSCKSELCTS